MHVELHFVIKDLYKLLHGREVARLELRPHWNICHKTHEGRKAPLHWQSQKTRRVGLNAEFGGSRTLCKSVLFYTEENICINNASNLWQY